MNLRVIFCLFLVCNIWELQAQDQAAPPLRGVITILNSKTQTGKTQYVRTAEVRANLANPTLSDSEGRFRLTFIDSEPGVEVELDVKKEGLEVVNKDALKAVLRKDPDFLLKVYMCDPEQLAASVLNYRGVAEKFIVAKYQAKIAQLKKENKAKAAIILELEDQKSAALRQFQDIAARLAAVNLDEAPGVYRQALELFQKGKLDEALSLIEKADLDAQLKDAVQQRTIAEQLAAKSQQRIDEIANTYLLQARLHVANLALTQAQVAYRKAITARDSTSIPDNLEYARLMIAQNQSWKIISLLEHTLQLCAKAGPEAAYTQLLLGTAQMNRVEIPTAIIHLTESVQLYAGLTEKDPLHYGSFAGVAILTCAAAHLFNSNQTAAAEIATYGRDVFQALMDVDSTRYLPYYAWSLYADAALSLRYENVDKVIEYYSFLTRTKSPRYGVFLGSGKILKAAILRDSMARTELDDEHRSVLETTSDQLYQEGLQLLLQQLKDVQRSYPNIGFMVNGADEVPDFEALMEESDYPISVLFSGLQLWWLRQALYGQQEGMTTEQVLKLIVDKTRMLSEQNRDRYLPQYAQYVAFQGFNYALNDRSREAFPLIEEGLKLVDDPAFAQNPAQRFLHSLLEAQLGIAHAFCYIDEGHFCEITREELLQLCDGVFEKLAAYQHIPLMDQTVSLIDIFRQGLRKCQHARSLKTYMDYRYKLADFIQAVEQKNNNAISASYFTTMEALEDFLSIQFETEDAMLLDTMYSAWYTAGELSTQNDALLEFLPKALALKYDLINAQHSSSNISHRTLSTYLSDGAWSALQQQQNRTAIEMASYASVFDPGNPRPAGIKAHALLLGGQQKRALRLYEEWCDKPYSTDSNAMCKSFFLSELAQLPGSSNSVDAAQAKAIMDGSSQSPELLIKGLNILKEANKRWHQGFLALMNKQKARESFAAAKQWYDQLLRPPYLEAGYFDDDFADIWFKLTFMASFQDKKPPTVPSEWGALMPDNMSRQLLQQSYAALMGTNRDSLWLWSEKLLAAESLAEVAHARMPKSEDMTLGLAQVCGQSAYAQLLLGKNEKALMLAQKAMQLAPQSNEVALSAIPVLYVNNKVEEMKALAKANEQSNLTMMGVNRSMKSWLKSRLYQLEQLSLIGDKQIVLDLLGW